MNLLSLGVLCFISPSLLMRLLKMGRVTGRPFLERPLRNFFGFGDQDAPVLFFSSFEN